MSATVYSDANHQGPFAQIRPGFFSGRDQGLREFRNQTACGSGEGPDTAISSIRVGPSTIVTLYGRQPPSASTKQGTTRPYSPAGDSAGGADFTGHRGPPPQPDPQPQEVELVLTPAVYELLIGPPKGSKGRRRMWVGITIFSLFILVLVLVLGNAAR